MKTQREKLSSILSRFRRRLPIQNHLFWEVQRAMGWNSEYEAKRVIGICFKNRH